MNDIDTFDKQFKKVKLYAKIKSKEFSEVVRIIALARKGEEEKLIQLVADCTAAQAVVKATGEIYLDVLTEI